MYGLKKNSILFITIIGFLVTVSLGVFGLSYFDIHSLCRSPIFFILIGIIIFCIIICASLSLTVICSISKNLILSKSLNLFQRIKYGFYIVLPLPFIKKKNNSINKYYWEYPDNKYIKDCMSGIDKMAVDLAMECTTLSKIINHNRESNRQIGSVVNRALVFLIVAIFIFIGL